MKNHKDVNIFIVDDNLFCLNLYQTNLANHGFEKVSTFDNSIECLQQLHHQPDIVFVDHDMQPINGLELMKQIKHEHANTLVVFVSAQRHVKNAIAALQQGADEYIVKDGTETTKMLETIHQFFAINPYHIN